MTDTITIEPLRLPAADFAQLLGARVRTARQARDMTQGKLAEGLGFASYTAVQKIERGDVQLTCRQLVRIAELLDIEASTLLDWAGPTLTDPRGIGPALRLAAKIDNLPEPVREGLERVVVNVHKELTQ